MGGGGAAEVAECDAVELCDAAVLVAGGAGGAGAEPSQLKTAGPIDSTQYELGLTI